MHQLSLFPERLSLQERFERFDVANPAVYALFLRFAREARAKGKQRYGAKAVWERLRWELSIETDETAPALNNDYPAFYARKAAREFPTEFGDGFFEFRQQTSKEG